MLGESIIDGLIRKLDCSNLKIEKTDELQVDIEPVGKNQKKMYIYFDSNGNITRCVIIDGTKRSKNMSLEQSL